MHVEFKSLWLSVLLIHSCLQGSACVTGLKALTISINFCVFVCAVTIISGIIMLILFVSELQYYLTKEVSSTCTTYRYPPPLHPRVPSWRMGSLHPVTLPLSLISRSYFVYYTYMHTHTQINIYCVNTVWPPAVLSGVSCQTGLICVWTHTQSIWPKVLNLPYSVHDTDVTMLV